MGVNRIKIGLRQIDGVYITLGNRAAQGCGTHG
jgi:hypothetical protein